MRVKGKNINFSKTAPTKVSDMEEGEIRVTADGIYGRVGNQVLNAIGMYQILPLLLTCDSLETYYQLEEQTNQWDLDTEVSISEGVLTKININPKSAQWRSSPYDVNHAENCTPFVLPLITAEINLSAISSICPEVFTLQGNYPVNDQNIGVRLDDTTKEIYVEYLSYGGTVNHWVEGSGWQSGSGGSGVTWVFDKWWKFEMERSGSQWRISIKNELGTQMILTDWVEWTDTRFEITGQNRFDGNAGSIWFGEGNSGPHGVPEGQIRNFACCTGLKRLCYNSFITNVEDHDFGYLYDVVKTGGGGTLSCLNDNYDFNLAAGPSTITATQTGWANTGESVLDEFDMWSKLHLPASLTTEGEMYMQLLFTGYNLGGAHEAGLRLRWTGSQYQMEYRAADSTYTDDWTAVAGVTGMNEIWVRFKFLPSQGDTEIEMYYSDIDPSVAYGGWKRVFPATASPNMSNLVQADGADFEVKGYNNDSGSQQLWIEFASDARLETFLTTTTTTTTT